MLDRLNDLDEKLELLLERFSSVKKKLDGRDKENARLKNKITTLKKGGGRETSSDDEALEIVTNERDELAEQLLRMEQENKKLKKQIAHQDKQLKLSSEREKETLTKIQSIISRIDDLEAEIGELENG